MDYIIVAVVFSVVGFIGGLLVMRKHKAKIDGVVDAVKK